jgi:hypothetical protein
MLHAGVYSLHYHVVMVRCLIFPGSMQPHPADVTKLKILQNQDQQIPSSSTTQPQHKGQEYFL